MSPSEALENSVETLRSDIDEISTCLLVGGGSSISADRLQSLAAKARESGFPEAARIAESLATKVNQSNGGSCDEALCDGLNEIRASLDNGRVTDSSPAQASQAESAAQPSIVAPVALAEDPELISDFLVESREHLSLIENQALELEKNPGSKEVVHAVFRTFHTIKGLAGFLEFTSIVELAHDVETLLDHARNDRISINSSIVDVVLESADYLKSELIRIESQLTEAGAQNAADNTVLRSKIAELSNLENGAKSSKPEELPPPQLTSTAEPEPEESIAPAQLPAAVVTTANAASDQLPQTESEKSPESGSVRVDTSKLDHLLEMVGEMVIAQSLIRNHPAIAKALDERLLADVAQLTRSTADIQRTTMSMRMVPIGQVFQRTARLVRDLSRKSNKQVVFESSGEDTEVDKTVAELLCDPLLHMVRNGVDHGVESQGERIAAGKSAVAHIWLKAYHQAGQIVIEISDDGKGLDREKILEKGIRSGLVQNGAQLTDSDVYQLIFEPGFSTAETVTDVSGRGVGMDVVRRNVQKLRGRIEIESTPGQGTTFLIRVPLTLAIIDGLVMVVGSGRYVVPVFAIREMLRPTAEMLSTVQGREEMALVRGRLLPIVRLHNKFGIVPKSAELTEGVLVVVESIDKVFCLFVDDLIGKQEIVIKSLGRTFKDVPGLAGCAVLGNGQIGLILDMDGVYRGGAR